MILGQISLSDLPALSDTVREIIALVDSKSATSEALSEAILKDFSLTNKILQLVNSPYYCRIVPISSVSRAVAVLGFHPVRDIAVSIGLFEDFLKAGLEKEVVTTLLVESFVSAEFARAICFEERLQFSGEEAFICTLLHNLGRIIILIYYPDLYRAIEERMTAGEKEEEVAPALLGGLSFHQVGQEVARFWNFSEHIIATMLPKPRKPSNIHDKEAMLHVLVVFCNRVTRSISNNENVSVLVRIYGGILELASRQPLELFLQSVERAAATTPILRFALNKLKRQSKWLLLPQKSRDSSPWV